jgi:hypothetical protein
MSSAGVEAILFQDSPSSPIATTEGASEQASVRHDRLVGITSPYPMPRRTPRRSLIVVLPENHAVSPELVTDRLPAEGDSEVVDVILACAGQPHSISALHRRVRDIQVLLAPAGTSTEDLRELAMNQAAGDIVTLLSGTPVCA